MTRAQTVNAQANGPEILERLSELEERDKSATDPTRSRRAVGWSDPRGYTVLNTTGHTIGTVEDLYVDPNTRDPYFALLSLGNHALGVGNRSVLVRFSDIEVSTDKHVRVRTSIGPEPLYT
jgi:sporulation protein YlmC with PRC-barrel domain